MNLELIKEKSNKLKPTATIIRTSTGITVERSEHLSDTERTDRVAVSLEAGRKRHESAVEVLEELNDDTIPFEQMTKTQQLVAMGKAMGGPRFPNFTLKPYQKSDDVEEFGNLLEIYLNLTTTVGDDAGSVKDKTKRRTVNDTASFCDYFGHDLDLQDWSLLHVSACVFVNAPKCMKLLLENGANPLQKDSSSGRHPVMEALATARHGYFGPWNVMKEYFTSEDEEDEMAEDGSNKIRVLIRPSDVIASKLADVTEAMIVALRRGKMGITPQQTRQYMHNFWKEGFKLYSKHYTPKEIHDHFHEMILISYNEMKTMGCIPIRQSGSRTSLSDLISLESEDGRNDDDNSNKNRAKVIFLSHRWLRPQQLHPDDEEQTKYRDIMNACELYCQKYKVSLEKLYLWVDYSCIDQRCPNIKIRSIQSLPFYILMSDGFIAIDHRDYMTRAWCMLEINSAMVCQSKRMILHYVSTDERIVIMLRLIVSPPSLGN